MQFQNVHQVVSVKVLIWILEQQASCTLLATSFFPSDDFLFIFPIQKVNSVYRIYAKEM